MAALALALAACGDVRSGTRLTIETGIHPPGTCPATGFDDHLDRARGRCGGVPGGGPLRAGRDRLAHRFAAWVIEDGTILYAPDGATVLDEGGTVTIGGAAGGPGEPFRVCSVGARTYS